MAVIKFPCSACQKLMAVGPELAGRKVRCPHCHQVLVAPAAAPEAESDNLFQFAKPPEGQDSIFGEPADDSVLGPARQAAPNPSAGVEDNPFAPPRPAPREQRDETAEQPVETDRRPRGSAAASGKQNWVLALLVPYALFMTVMAIFYYVKYSRAVQDHPLEQIPDLMGEFQKDVKKDGKPVVRAIKLPPADQPLPDKLVTSLGRPITVGSIEVTPLSVEYRPWAAFTKDKTRAEVKKVPVKTTLVMHVRLRNVSPDLTFYPTDPYFDRNPKHPNDKPYTLVDVGGKMFFGGVIEFVTVAGTTERTWLQGQENDNKPLGPGESRETVFVTRPRDGVFDAVQQSKGQAVWRIQVRRGLVPYEGHEIPASAVVGVAFTAADVRKAG
jgi:hypothetical protein